jgi:hypothetical protein
VRRRERCGVRHSEPFARIALGAPGRRAEEPMTLGAGRVWKQNQMLRREPLGNWSYAYFSLIDPKSSDSSFMTITDSPYLYYVRMDGNHPPYQRVLFRQKIKLDWLTALHPKPVAPAHPKTAAPSPSRPKAVPASAANQANYVSRRIFCAATPGHPEQFQGAR